MIEGIQKDGAHAGDLNSIPSSGPTKHSCSDFYIPSEGNPSYDQVWAHTHSVS